MTAYTKIDNYNPIPTIRLTPTLNAIKTLQTIPTIRTIPTLRPIRMLGEPNYYGSGLKAVPFNFQKANSFADVIVGGPFGTRELRNTLDANGLSWAKNIPLLNKTVGALALAKNQLVDPLFEKGIKQGSKEAFLNLLINAGETIDLFSNLIKSQFWDAGGHPGLENMANAWGIGDRETRITYNFNTGNFFGDVALEILTDPLNWFSLGSKALGGAAINTVGDVVEETVENTVKTNIDDVSKVLLKNVSKESADDFADVTTKFVTKKVLKQFDGDITFDTIKRYLKKTTIEEFENISKELLDYGLRNDIFEQTVKSAMKDTVASSAKALRWYAAANAFKDSVEAVDTALTHVAWAPVYYPFQAIKKSGLAKGIVNRIHNKLVSLLADYVKTDDIINPKKAYDYISANIFSESEYYFGDLINKNKNFLDKLGISAYALQEQYLAMFRTMSYDELQKLTMDDIRMKFIEYLASHNNALIKELMLNADELKFLEAMSIGPIMIRKAELETLMHTNSMQIDRVIKNINSKQTLIQKLKLLDSQILMYNNQHYGIEHLPDFIRKVIINSDSIPYQDRVLIKQLIDDLGLNPKNYKQVAEFLKNNNTKAIVKIIKNTQNSPRFIDDKLLNEFIQSSTKYNQEKIIPALKVFFEKDLKELGDKTYQEYLNFQIKNVKDAVEHINNSLNKKEAYTYINKLLRQTQFISQDVLQKDINAYVYLTHDVLVHYDPALSHKLTAALLYQNEILIQSDALIKRFAELGVDNPDLITSSELTKWFNALQNAQQQLAILQEGMKVFEKSQDTTVKELNNFINQLDGMYKILLADDFKIDICDYIEDIDELIKVQLSYKGMYDIFNQHLTLTEDPEFKETMRLLMNPQSELRARIIPDLIQALDNAHLSNLSESIRDTLVQIDMFTSTQKIFNSDLVAGNLTKAQERYIKTLIFDAIRNNGGYTIQQVMDSNKEIIKKMTDFIEENTRKHIFTIDSRFFKVAFEDADDLNGRLAYSNLAKKRIVIKKDLTVDELFDYIKGTTKSATSLQKQQVFEQLAKQGYDEAYLRGLIKTNQDAKIFLYFHELSHMFNKDHIAASRGADLFNIEYRACLDAIKGMTDVNSHIATIMQSAEHILMTYLEDISKLTDADHVIYSMYSANTIKNIRKLPQYFKNIVPFLDVPAQAYGEYEALMTYLTKYANAVDESIGEIAKKNSDLISYMQYYDAHKQLTQQHLARNLMEASIESETYAIKRVNNTAIANRFKFTRDMFVGTNSEYMLLTDRLAALTKYHIITETDQALIQDLKYMAQIREALIRTYSDTSALFAMKDPRLYFESLDDLEVYYWVLATKGNLSKRNANAFNNILYNIKIEHADMHTKTFNELNTMLEQVVSDKNYLPDWAFDNVIEAMANSQFEEVQRYVDISLRSLPKDSNLLKIYKDEIANFIKQEVAANNDIFKTVQKIERPFATVKNGYQILQDIQQEMCANRALAVSRMTPTELARYIDVNTPGAIIFYNNNIIKHIAADGSIWWSGLPNPLPYTDADLAAVGLKRFIKDDLIIIRPIGETKKANELIYRFAKYDSDMYKTYAKNQLENLVNRYKDYLNIEQMEIPLENTPVEALSESLWNSLLENEELSEIFGNAEEQKLYQKLNVNGQNIFFNKGYSRLNNTIIGGFDALDHIQELYQKPGETIIYHSKSATRNTLAGLTAFLLRSNRKTKYISLFFNDDYVLGNSVFNELFNGTVDGQPNRKAIATDAEIKKFFSSGDFKAAVLKKTADGRPLVTEYKIYDRASLHRAIESKAILLPDSIYRAARLTVNYKGLDETAWGLYKRIVMMTYKSLDLLTLGFPFRNAIDSLGYKNINELGFTQAMRYNFTAIKMLKFHNDIQRQVLDLTGNKTFNKETLFKVLENYSEKEQVCYFLIDLFMNSPASGGYSKAFSEYLEEYNSVSDLRTLWEKRYTELVFKKEWSPIHILNDVNDSIEQTARLGLFLGMLDKGSTVNDAIRRVVKTHFDYTAKPPLMDFCEKIFWFSTFPINNLSYYLTDGLSKNPMLLRTLMDAETASWNNGEYTYEELKKTNFLAYHAMTGNLRIGKYIIKLSPSVFDMLGLYMQPITSILDRLNPFVSVPLDAIQNNANWWELYPLNTQRMNMQKLVKWLEDPEGSEGSFLPSIVAQISDPGLPSYMYNSRRYNSYSKYTRPRWTKYPRIKPNPNLMRRYTPKYYAKLYRWWHTKHLNTLNINRQGTTVIDPRYLNNVKLIRALRIFNRTPNHIKTV